MSTTNSQPPELMTPAQVAALFQVGPKTVTRWAAEGRIEFVRTLGGHRRFHRDSVMALLRGDIASTDAIIRELVDEGFDVTFSVAGEGEYTAGVYGDGGSFHGYGASPEAALTDAWHKRNGSQVRP